MTLRPCDSANKGGAELKTRFSKATKGLQKLLSRGPFIRIPLFLAACTAITDDASLAETLHFKSGFEEGTHIIDNNGNPDPIGVSGSKFAGTDATTGYNWVEDLAQGREFDIPDKTLGNQRFNLDSNSEGTGAYVNLIEDPTSSGRGKVAQFWISDPTDVKGRVQMVLYGSDTDLNEVTSVTKLYLHPDLAVLEPKEVANFGYFIFNELFFNPDYNSTSNPDLRNYRVGLSFEKSSSKDGIFFSATSDVAGSTGRTYWHYTSINDGIRMPVGEWVTLVMYYKKGDADTGRFKLKFFDSDGVEHVVFDITNWTMPDISRDPDLAYQQTGLTHHIPLKLYTPDHNVDFVRENTASGGIKMYWDDFEYYEGDAYTGYGTNPESPLAPTMAVATSITANPFGQIDLNWIDNADNETGYQVDRADNAGFSVGLSTDDSVPANATQYQSTGLSENSTYYYRVRAVNAFGASSNSNTTQATTGKPDGQGGEGGIGDNYESEALIVSDSSGDTAATANNPKASGGAFHQFEANEAGDFIAYTIDAPIDGTYRVLTGITLQQSRGIYQLQIDGINQGTEQNYFAGEDILFAERDLGQLFLSAGSHSFRFEAVGTSGTGYTLGVDYITLVNTEVDSVPSILTTSLTSVQSGNGYSQILFASGGNRELSWSLDSGTLPSGISLSSDGVISGTPDSAGVFVFTVRLADSDGNIDASDEDTQEFSIEVVADEGAVPTIYEAESLEVESDSGDTKLSVDNVEASGEAFHFYIGNETGDYITYLVNVPTSNTYRVVLRSTMRHSRGIAQLFIDGLAQSGPQDFHYPGSPTLFGQRDLGLVELSAGVHAFRFESFGTNGSSHGFGPDYISLTSLLGTDAPEFEVRGNGNAIADGDDTPSAEDRTDFGDADVEEDSVNRAFSIANLGDEDLIIESVSLTGDQADEFSVFTQPTSPIEPSSSISFSIAFDPKDSGIRSANVVLVVKGTNGVGVLHSFAIQGNGTGLSIITFKSIQDEDGGLFEESEESDTAGSINQGSLQLGDGTKDRGWRSLVSFDTSTLPPGAIITSAILRIERNRLTNESPFDWGGECRVDIKSGGFNGNEGLELEDWGAAADAENVALMSSPAENGDWSEGALDNHGLSLINGVGKTQLRIYFEIQDNDNDRGDKLLFFEGGANEDHRPELIVKFKLPAPGDFDGNGVIDVADRLIIIQAFNAKKGDDRYVAAADLNDDSTINHLDYREWLVFFLQQK